MTRKRRAAVPGPPLTTENISHTVLTKPAIILVGKPIVCSKCGLPGGTMVKDGKDGYCHQDEVKCKMLQSRRKR